MKTVILGLIVVLTMCASSWAGPQNKNDVDIRKFKDQIVIELYTNGPLLPAKRVWFTTDEILVEPVYSDPNFKMFSYKKQPRIIYTDSVGNPTEVYVNQEAGYIIIEDKIIPIPACLE